MLGCSCYIIMFADDSIVFFYFGIFLLNVYVFYFLFPSGGSVCGRQGSTKLA